MKNLFLRGGKKKKKRFYLLSALEDTETKFKSIGDVLEEKSKFGFASMTRIDTYMCHAM